MKKVTIQEIAKELDLSRNTVAKALNNNESVANDTRYVVIKKAYEMGYSKLSPLILDEFKIKDRLEDIKTIVVLAKRELSSYWNRIIMGISDELNKHNCKLQFNFISDEDEEEGILPLDLLAEISGIIMLSVFQETYIELILKKNRPIVFLDGPPNSKNLINYGDIVMYEAFHSMRFLTQHIVEQGINKIAFVGDISHCGSVAEKYNGFRAQMLMSQIKIDEQCMITGAVQNHYKATSEIKDAISHLPYIPQAFICVNDDIAIEVMFCLKELGYIIGSDVVVTGFGNKEESKYVLPSLTTVASSNLRLGQRLVQILMWRLENKEMPHEIISIHTDLIIRESSLLTASK